MSWNQLKHNGSTTDSAFRQFIYDIKREDKGIRNHIGKIKTD
jgi:hypothetical protein